jgi:chemotaxis response regulator CheB
MSSFIGGTRAALDAAATAAALTPGQIYVITDENRVAVATSENAYQAAAKQGEGGGGSGPSLGRLHGYRLGGF